jgi:site-specific recombinase XerD
MYGGSKGPNVTTTLHQDHTTHVNFEGYIETWVQTFLNDKRSQKLSHHTLRFYALNLEVFIQYCDLHGLKWISDLTPPSLWDFLLYLEGKGNNFGGQLVHHRTVKDFLNWY